MNYRYVDIHAHVNINAFKDDWQDVIERTRAAGVAHINVGTQYDTSTRTVEIAEQYEDGVYSVVGLHPIHTSASYHDSQELGEESQGFTSRGEAFDAEKYRTLLASDKVVAIGECGLDYFRQTEDTRALQEEAFIAQIELANELNKPLMLHIRTGEGPRNAYDDAYAVLKAHARVPGNVHFYAGTLEQAKRFFDLGFTVSFTGVITFTHDYDEVVKGAPLDMIHAETDCPYVAPKPYRGTRNEPIYVQEVYRKIAELRGDDDEVVRTQLLANAQRLYGVPLVK